MGYRIAFIRPSSALFTLLLSVCALSQSPFNLTNHRAEDRYPSFSPDGRSILFESDRNGNWDIFLINEDGSDLRQITTASSNERFPAWHPKGTEIVFQSDKGGSVELFTMTHDGSDWKQITRREGAEMFPAWSPDGKFISFTQDVGSNNFDIFLLDLKAGQVRDLITGPGRHVWSRWSPNGKFIAYHWRNDTTDRQDEIYVYDVRKQTAERITRRSGHDFCPAWSRNGRNMAFAATDENGGQTITVTDLKGKVIAQLGNGLPRVSEPSWSPNGKKIAYLGRQLDKTADIYIELVRK
jgi:TolB protein